MAPAELPGSFVHIQQLRRLCMLQVQHLPERTAERVRVPWWPWKTMEIHGESWNIILVSSSKAHGLTIVDGFGASLAHQELSENDLQIVVFFP